MINERKLATIKRNLEISRLCKPVEYIGLKGMSLGQSQRLLNYSYTSMLNSIDA